MSITTSSVDRRRAGLRGSVALIALAVLASASHAQPRDLPVWSGAETDVDTASAPMTSSEPDLSGLRYFVQTNDSERYAREVARLRALHPDWRPPADPSTIPAASDAWLDRVWSLVAEGKHDQAAREIALREEAEPGWTPSRDLAGEVRKLGVRKAIAAAAQFGDDGRVVALAAALPGALGCSDPQATWTVAEALGRIGREARAAAVYGALVRHCSNAEMREATLRKALDVLPAAAFDALATEVAADGAAGMPVIGDIRIDAARRVLANSAIAPEEVQEKHRAAVRDAFADTGAASDATLLGWDAHARGATREAFTWFNRARAISPSESSGIGFVLTALELGYFVDAEDVGHRWHDASANARAAYMAAVVRILSQKPRFIIDAERIARISTAVETAQDPEAASQLGWYAYNFGQFDRAEAWFRASLDWAPNSEPASYGLALALARQGKLAEAAEIQAAWEGRSDRILMLRDPKVGDEDMVRLADTRSSALRTDHPDVVARPPIVEAYARLVGMNTMPAASTDTGAGAAAPAAQAGGKSRSAVHTVASAPASGAACGGSGNLANLAPGDALARGWCMMEKDRAVAAARAFERARASSDAQTRRDASYGLSLAKSRSGLTSQAALAANGEEAGSERAQDLSRIILASRATSAFEQKRYRAALAALAQHDRIAPRQVDLMIIEGWSYYHLGRQRDARRVFEAAARAGSTDAVDAIDTLDKVRAGR